MQRGSKQLRNRSTAWTSALRRTLSFAAGVTPQRRDIRRPRQRRRGRVQHRAILGGGGHQLPQAHVAHAHVRTSMTHSNFTQRAVPDFERSKSKLSADNLKRKRTCSKGATDPVGRQNECAHLKHDQTSFRAALRRRQVFSAALPQKGSFASVHASKRSVLAALPRKEVFSVGAPRKEVLCGVQSEGSRCMSRQK